MRNTKILKELENFYKNMGNKKESAGYKTVRIPVELLEQIETIISDFPSFGYKKKAEFIKEAIRVRIVELLRTYEIQQENAKIPSEP